MLLDVLRLQHFRNLSCVELEPHPRFNIFAGDNGQGKTNLLEAIYLLSSVRSFRARTNEALIEFGHDCSILEARVDRGGHERVVRIEIDESGKEVFLNRSPVQRLSDFFGTVNVVKFGPDDMSLLEGSPSDRRDFIDDAVLSARPGFATELDHYGDALDQRNAALKQDDPDETLLEIYGRQLAQYGADVVARRLEFVERFEPVLSRVFDDVFGGGLEASVQYDMKWADGLDVPRRPPERREAIEDLLVEALAETADRERDRGYTLVGPHRDDLQAYLDGRDIAVYGSQGQHRAFILAMKIAVTRYLKEEFRFDPILLLDDVSSELDRERNRQLFDFLRERSEGQVFITTTHRDHIHLDRDLEHFRVEDGRIEPEADGAGTSDG